MTSNSPFPIVFSKDFSCRHENPGLFWEGLSLFLKKFTLHMHIACAIYRMADYITSSLLCVNHQPFSEQYRSTSDCPQCPICSRIYAAWNPLPPIPILGSSNSSANEDMMSKILTNGDTFSDWVENIVGKEEIARYEQFLLFQQCFQKRFIVDALKWVSIE